MCCVRGNGPQDLLREALPALVVVGPGLACCHGEAGIEEQHALLRPAVEAAGRRERREWQVGLPLALHTLRTQPSDLPMLRRLESTSIFIDELFVDILQTAGDRDPSWDRKAVPARLVGPVIRVLANDDNFDGV